MRGGEEGLVLLVPCEDIALAVISAMVASAMGLEALSIWKQAIAVLCLNGSRGQ